MRKKLDNRICINCFCELIFIDAFAAFDLLIPHLVTPIGTAIAMTRPMPINRPIPSPIKHGFEQTLDFLLK